MGHSLPNVAELVGPLLASVPEDHRALLLALAERLAADRYRGWASGAEAAAERRALTACAEREDEIAARVEALHDDAAAAQKELLAQHPELAHVNRSLFAERPLAEQYAIQAQGERVGAATWRSFAKRAQPAARDAFLACAELEERNAEALEALLERAT